MEFLMSHKHDDSCPEFVPEDHDMSLIWNCNGSEWLTNGASATEVRTTSSTGGEKGTKPERFDLIPIGALAMVAKLYGRGAEKYAAHNWRKGYEWSKSYSALQRHANAFWDGEDIDPEMQLPHMASVVFHALALITFMQEQPGFDDRFKGFDSEAEEVHFTQAVLAMRTFARTGAASESKP